MGGKTRRIYFYDCHLINWKNDFSSAGSQPMCETLEITAAGFNNSNASTEYSAYWRETFPENNVQVTTIDKEPLKKSKLGETVYFHVDVEGLADGQEITLKLYEQDKNIFMMDWIDPDDEKFPEEEVVKKATIKNAKATVELLLQESWEGMVKDDHDNSFSSNQSLELYWEVSYNNKYKTELPLNDKNYLLVGQNDRTLYIKPFESGHNMPEFFDYDGNPLAYMQISTNNAIDPQLKNEVEKEHANQVLAHAGGILKDKAVEGIANYSGDKISEIALARLIRQH